MISVVLDDVMAVPLGDESVYSGEHLIGQVTSTSFAYRIGQPLALAYIKSEYAVDGESIELDIAGRRYTGKVHTKAVFDPTGSRMKS